MGGIPKHCVHGDVGASDQNSLCDSLAAQLEEYAQAGEIMSTTVRVKDGENKSWCLVTFSHARFCVLRVAEPESQAAGRQGRDRQGQHRCAGTDGNGAAEESAANREENAKSIGSIRQHAV